MDTIQSILLYIHIGAGFSSLAAAFIAVMSKALDANHKAHVLSGRIFFWGMFIVFLTAVPISLITRNIFLLLIAVFSFYLALSGWCYAKNRKGTALRLDWIRSIGMLLAALAMAVYGISLLSISNTYGYIMLVFAGIGAALSINDLRILLSSGVTGAERIGNHLTMMLAASIATITAFLVVNINFQPAYIVWLTPTVIITPLIVVWKRRIGRGDGPEGIPGIGSPDE